MKRLLNFIPVLCFSLFLTGCSTIGNTWDSIFKTDPVVKEQKLQEKIDNNYSKIYVLEENQNEDAKSFVYGTGLALKKIQEDSPAVVTSIDLNQRAQNILGLPSSEHAKEMANIVDKLCSTIIEQQKEGQKLLNKKDEQIFKNEKKIKDLETEIDKNYNEYNKLAKKNAALASDGESFKNEMNSWFGFGAILHGSKQLIKSIMWFLIIGFVLYLVLRTFAATNPVIGAIFGLFEGVVASIIQGLKMIAPKAVEITGYVNRKDFELVKKSRNKIIDALEELKRDSEKDPTKVFTINDLLDKLEDDFGDDDKEEFERALKSLKWK